MKIWCDVCNSKEASVFCSADEASLCLDCDPKVHQANKLASKHQRFALLKPTSSDFPLCDICQEKKALLFCQQDRAILCRDCDISIHASNEYTQKHNRYLLTGIKLSPSSASNLPVATVSNCTNTKQMSKDGTGGSSSNNSGGFDQVPDFKSDKSNSTKKIVPSYTSSANYSEISSTLTNEVNNNKSQRPAPNVKSTTASKDGSIIQLISNSGSGGNNSDGSTTSSISEYLIEMLPGWQVEDLLQDSSSVPFSYSKIQDNSFLGIDLLPNKDDERDRSFENMGLWVPQAPSPLLPLQPSTPFSTNIEFGMNHGFIQNHHQTAKGENNKKPSSRKKMIMNNNAHDGFMVPQLSPQFLSGSNKRSRPFY